MYWTISEKSLSLEAIQKISIDLFFSKIYFISLIILQSTLFGSGLPYKSIGLIEYCLATLLQASVPKSFCNA